LLNCSFSPPVLDKNFTLPAAHQQIQVLPQVGGHDSLTALLLLHNCLLRPATPPPLSQVIVIPSPF
jgi:hypothetical protein